jgi:hypothetical protein
MAAERALRRIDGPPLDSLDDYWISMLFASESDAQMLQAVLYARLQYFQLQRSFDWVTPIVELSFLRGGFGRRYGALLEALARLEEEGQVDALLGASDYEDLSGLAVNASGSQTWSFVLLLQVSRAREHLASSPLGAPLLLQGLRRKHEEYCQSALDGAALRGLVVVLGAGSSARRLCHAQSARRALGRVPPRLLLERTRVGAPEIVSRVLQFCSESLTVAVDTEEELRRLSPWPLGTKLVTARTDAEAVRRLLDTVEGLESAYIYCAAGTLVTLLLSGPTPL